MSLYLGIDTSNYTTSVAVSGERSISLRKIIDVKEGMRGIRQSDGVFVHLKELPRLFDALDIDMADVKAVGVSARPRNREGSYMPVFVAGESFAKVIAKSLGVPLFEYSHQDGHIMAGIISGGFFDLLGEQFLAVHLSGGTTEILNCRYRNNRFAADIIGGTKDISAGQLIDRLGVKLGMKFPCGKEIDALSLSAGKTLGFKTSVDGSFMNFSGIETKALSMTETADGAVLARSVLEFIGESLAKAINAADCKNVLFVGGVASNTLLRRYLSENISARVMFASPELSSDNAAGIAELCKREAEEKRNFGAI